MTDKFRPGDRVVTPYGTAVVDKVETTGCFVIYDESFAFCRTLDDIQDMGENATWYPFAQLQPEPTQETR